MSKNKHVPAKAGIEILRMSEKSQNEIKKIKLALLPQLVSEDVWQVLKQQMKRGEIELWKQTIDKHCSSRTKASS